MKDWKVKQQIYHRLNNEYSDDLNKVDITFTNDVLYHALRHFNEKIDDWIYPSKSYFVGYCYAVWINEDFGDNIIDLLNDPELLAGNDPYFKTYDENKEIYDVIIDTIGYPIPMKGMVPDVRKYYDLEIGF